VIRDRSLTFVLLLGFAVLAATVAGCGGDGEKAAATAAQTTTGTSSTTTSSRDQGWERVVPGGDCQCWDGSEFSFWVREASPKKVVYYLESGGGFSAETCAPDRGFYKTKITARPTSGIFDFADERNPFADYSVVYVPYCTGDVHIGTPPGSTPPASPSSTRGTRTAAPPSTS
jgi:hypothetical protein